LVTLTRPPPPRAPLFPYTTLFRSARDTRHRFLTLVRDTSLANMCDLVAGQQMLCSRGTGVRASCCRKGGVQSGVGQKGLTEGGADRKSTRLNSSHVKISYAVFCLK